MMSETWVGFSEISPEPLQVAWNLWNLMSFSEILEKASQNAA